MKKSRSLVVLASTAFLASALSACSSSGSDDVASNCKPVYTYPTITKGVLTVAAVQQLPGINVDPNTGKMEGLDATLLTDFAAKSCLKLDVQPLAGPAAVAAMTEGKADLAAGGWYKTPERAKVLGQSTTIWYDQVGLVSKDGIDSVEGLRGKKVGLVGGSIFEAPATQALGKGSIVTYQSIDAIFKDLEAGRIDAAFGAGATLSIQLKNRTAGGLQLKLLAFDKAYPELTTPGEPNYPYTKSNTALGTAIDSFVEQARKDGRVKEGLAKFGITSPEAITGPQK